MKKKPARVYLVRHGKAEDSAEGGDAARPLTPEGRARFFALAGSLADELDLARILTSPLVRARQTADILAAATGAPVEEEADLSAGTSTASELLALARRAGAGAALVGHNPELGEAIALAAGRQHKVKPGTVAAPDLHERTAELAWLEVPEKD